MNKPVIALLIIALSAGCKSNNHTPKRIPVAAVGNVMLYYDQIPQLIHHGVNDPDSTALIQNYINKWAKKQLLFLKAETNLSAETKNDISRQLEETRINLVIYQYQRQMMLEKMDTALSDNELENYYAENEKTFRLTSNIVKALFIKLPLETPDINKIRVLARANDHNDQQQLDALCYQFAEKYDDFNEEWVPLDRLAVELQQNIDDQENFLKRNTFYETSDSSSVYLISIRDYRLRSSLAPYEYVKNDIKRIIWNTRRIEFLKSLEDGIYNDALRANSFKIYK